MHNQNTPMHNQCTTKTDALNTTNTPNTLGFAHIWWIANTEHTHRVCMMWVECLNIYGSAKYPFDLCMPTINNNSNTLTCAVTCAWPVRPVQDFNTLSEQNTHWHNETKEKKKLNKGRYSMTHYKVLSCLPVRPVSMESDEIRLNTLAGSCEKLRFFLWIPGNTKKADNVLLCYWHTTCAFI